MSIAAAMMFMIPPPLPPSGPVFGRFECLLQRASTDTAATISIAEGSEADVTLQGSFPVAISDKDTFILKTHGELALVDAKGKDRFRLVRKIPGRDGAWWQLNARAADDHFWKAGLCFGDIHRGRSDRPIILKSFHAVSVETVGVDE